jgi:hypothetical protein
MYLPAGPSVRAFGPWATPGHTAKVEGDRVAGIREGDMSSTQGQWAELSDRIEALALKLKLHLEQAEDDELREALGRLRQGVREAFEAAETAVKDDGVRSDVRDVGRLLVDAVSTTLAKASDEVRDAFTRRP